MGKSEPRVLVAHVASDGGILLIDVLQVGPLEHWLVPEWLDGLTKRCKRQREPFASKDWRINDMGSVLLI